MTAIIAHRGASRYAPENSMEAFQLAFKMKADGIETDVQLTKDHIPVLFHDEQTRRLLGHKGWINQYTLEQLKQMDMGKYDDKSFSGTKIVTLEEFLAWIKDKPLAVHLELKNNKLMHEQLEEIVYRLVQQYNLLDRTCFSTFSSKSIQYLASFPSISDIGWLTSRARINVPLYAKKMGAGSIHIKYRLLNQRLIKQAGELGTPIRVYTINTTRLLKYCFLKRVDAIFTDVPDKAFDIRKKIHQRYLK